MTADSSPPASNDATPPLAKRLAWALMAILAYVPALASSPGRMPADSKLYVYLNPGRFFGDAASTFDPRQFGGWVPHQHMSYLWPTAPWFWIFDRIGVPDWIAHRLWIGSLMFAAGTGAWWLARRTLGLSTAAALTAALAYQTSLYLLPYISRTSVMLLPWAGLGWIVALTARALIRRGWRDPALIALVVFTVGGVNATALALIIPGPVLWLLHARRLGVAAWKDVWRVCWRTALLSLGVSLWWIVMLTIQGRYGADVLAYSESLADVSFTSTAPEVTRGLGYWLFYIRDNFGPATTSSLRYLISTPAILLSFTITIVALIGLATTRWAHRSFGLALVATGAILGVGVHPIDHQSPLMNLLSGGGQGGLALALRSSTRALPLMTLGLSLGLASLVAAASHWRFPVRSSTRSTEHPTVGRSRLRGDWVVATILVLLVLANNPSLLRGDLIDPAIDRDQNPPTAWTEAAAAIDAAHGSDDRSRVLQLPGVEFGAFRWGYTVDQPLPALTQAGLVTRDLLPLGSSSTMDLLYALDDRVQDGVLEPDSIAPVARLLGADTIWLSNDVEYERFGTTRPQRLAPVLDSAPGLSGPTPYGPIQAYRTSVPVVQADTLAQPDRPTTPVALYQVEDPRPNDLVTNSLVVLSGSGAGLVDAAAADLIDGHEPIVYSANLVAAPSDDRSATDSKSSEQSSAQVVDQEIGQHIDRLIVSDSNRDQARQWRSSQDAAGFTETGGPEQGVLRPIASDQRLELFDTSDPATQTVAVQHGPMTAAATSYGEPFRYLPEHRPYMAIDGDPTTSWTVGDHGNPIGESLQLTFAKPLDADTSLSFLQAGQATDRMITTATFEAQSKDGHVIKSWSVQFSQDSRRAPGQAVDVPRDAAVLTVRIDAVDAGIAFTSSAVAGVGFREITAPPGQLGPTIEVVRVPTDGTDRIANGPTSNPNQFSNDLPIDYVFTRWRTDPYDRARSDPEPSLIREFDVPGRSLTVEPTVRLDPRATDDDLMALFGLPATASGHLLGSIASSASAAIDGDPSTMWITPFDDVVGSFLSVRTAVPTTEITVRQPVTGFSALTRLTLAVGTDQRTVTLVPDAAGEATATIDPPLPPGDLQVIIAAIEPSHTVDRRYGDPTVTPAAISDLSGPSIPVASRTTNWTYTQPCTPVATIGSTTITATVEFVPGQGLDQPLAVTPCVDALDLEGPQRLTTSPELPPGLELDRIVLHDTVRLPAAPQSDAQSDTQPVAVGAKGTTQQHSVLVTECERGCWLLDDVAANDGWIATDGARKLSSLPLAGSGQAWRVPAATSEQTITVRWTQQRKFNIALLVSFLFVLVCAVLAIRKPTSALRPQRSPEPPPTNRTSAATDNTMTQPPQPQWISPLPFGSRDVRLGVTSATLRCLLGTTALGAGLAAILVNPVWALPGGLIAGVSVVVGRRLVDWLAIAIISVAGLAIAWGERQQRPLPDGGWPHHFESWHRVVMFAISLLALAALMPPRERGVPTRPE